MRRLQLRLVLAALAVGVVLFLIATGCASTAGNASQTTYNPASGRMGALAGIPPDDRGRHRGTGFWSRLNPKYPLVERLA